MNKSKLVSSARKVSSLIAMLLVSSGCQNLVGAAYEKDLAAVNNLLAKGADPNEKADWGQTPLCEAIKQDSLEIVEALLARGARPNDGCTPYNAYGAEYKPLELAAERGDAAIVKTLLAHKAELFGEFPTVKTGRSGTEWISNTFLDLLSIARIKEDVREEIATAYVEQVVRDHGQKKLEEVAVRSFLVAATEGAGGVLRALFKRGIDPNTMVPATLLDGSKDEWPVLFFTETPDAQMVVVHAGGDPKLRSKQGLTFEAAREQVAARRGREAAEVAEFQRLVEEDNRQTDRENAEFARQAQERWKASGGDKPLENPVDDNRLHDTMMAQYKAETAKKAAADAQPRSTTSAYTGAGTTTTSTTSTNTGGGTTTTFTTTTTTTTRTEPKRDDDKAAQAALKAEEQKAEMARQNADREEKDRATKLAAQKATRDYLEAFQRGIRIEARRCEDSNYCARASMPDLGNREGRVSCIHVGFRARCEGSNQPWTEGGFSGAVLKQEEAYIQPKPQCDVKNVRIEVSYAKQCD